jgi:hypothetical protein
LAVSHVVFLHCISVGLGIIVPFSHHPFHLLMPFSVANCLPQGFFPIGGSTSR